MLTEVKLVAALLLFGQSLAATVTERDRLYADIFKDYNSKTFPVLDYRKPVVIAIQAYIVSVNRFDEISGELVLTLYFEIYWVEERITWNTTDYDGLGTIIVAPTDIWKPNLFVVQSSDKMQQLGNISLYPRIYSNGQVAWNPADELKVTCSVDVTYFPFDNQTCIIEFLGIVYSKDELDFYPLSDHILKEHFTKNSQWDVLHSPVANCSADKGISCFNMTLNLERKSQFYIVYILVPLLFLGIINNLVLVMPANSGERNSVAVTTFLSFVVYMSIVNGTVPQSSSPLSYLYFYLMFLMVYSSVIMFLCIVSLRIYNLQGKVPCLVKGIVYSLRCHCIKYLARKSWKKIKSEIKYVKKAKKGDVDRQMSGYFQNGSADIDRDKEIDDETNNDDIDNVDKMNEENKDEITWFKVGKTFDVFWAVALYIVYFSTSAFVFFVLFYKLSLI